MRSIIKREHLQRVLGIEWMQEMRLWKERRSRETKREEGARRGVNLPGAFWSTHQNSPRPSRDRRVSTRPHKGSFVAAKQHASVKKYAY